MFKRSKDRVPVILLTNDDGIQAKGLQALIELAKPFGRIVVVAPDEGNSGMSHAITIKYPLRLRKHQRNDDVEMYSVNGCLLYTSPSPRDRTRSRMPSSA